MTSMGGTAYGVASTLNNIDYLGTRVNAMIGINNAAPSGGIGQLPSEVRSFMHSDAGYGSSGSSDSALLRSDSYYGSTNIQESMPSDMVSSVLASSATTDVRTVNDGFSSSNDAGEYV